MEEIDNKKNDKELGYFARRAIRSIKKAKQQNKIKIIFNYSFSGANSLLTHKNDNHILAMAYETYINDKELVFLCDDYALFIKADQLGITSELFEFKEEDDVYKGYKELFLDTVSINNLIDEVSRGINSYNFLINEYVILHNTDLNNTIEYRFNGEKFVELKLPNSKVIKGKNVQQRFALDLLNNKDIPIKIIAGGFGSGKTILSVKMGLHHIKEKGTYKNMMFIRNPVVTDGAEIGFLPGDKSEKIFDYCRPFLQYLEDPNPKSQNQHYVEDLIRDEKVKMDVTSFLKGISIDDSYVIMDEAEDLNTKLIKLVGSRIGEKSCIVFTGDWNQAESKYKYDNGLLKLIRESKGNKLVGIVVLDEDVRSETSKVFANL